MDLNFGIHPIKKDVTKHLFVLVGFSLEPGVALGSELLNLHNSTSHTSQRKGSAAVVRYRRVLLVGAAEV